MLQQTKEVDPFGPQNGGMGEKPNKASKAITEWLEDMSLIDKKKEQEQAHQISIAEMPPQSHGKEMEEKWAAEKAKATTEKGAMRFNAGKEKWGLVNFEALKPMVQVLMYGAKKYEPRNWEKGLSKEEILESMLRHVFELLKGNLIDEESGLPHIGHIQCNALFYSYFTTVETKNARD